MRVLQKQEKDFEVVTKQKKRERALNLWTAIKSIIFLEYETVEV